MKPPFLKRFELPELLLDEIYAEKEEKSKRTLFLPFPLSPFQGESLPSDRVLRTRSG